MGINGKETKEEKESLEIRVGRIISKNPWLKSNEVAKLAEVTGKNPSGTVRGTAAWKKRKDFQDTKKPKRGHHDTKNLSGGFSKKDALSDVVSTIKEPQAEHIDINEMITEYQNGKRNQYPTPEDISEKLSTQDESVSIERAKELLKETEHIFGYNE